MTAILISLISFLVGVLAGGHAMFCILMRVVARAEAAGDV